MSWNPFKKKDEPVESPGAAAAAASDGTDATDPMGAAGQVEELVEPLRERNGVLLERVQLRGPAGGGGEFMRMSVREAGRRADAVRELLLSGADDTTGFRDLLVCGDFALAAALELPDHNLAELTAKQESPQAAPRPADLLIGMRDLARFLALAKREFGLGWPAPNIVHIGVRRDGDGAPDGFGRLHLQFAAWDQLEFDAGEPLELLTALASALTLLQEHAIRNGFDYAEQQLGNLLSRLEEISMLPHLDYATLAELVAHIEPRFELASHTADGQVREHNEDASLLLSLEQTSNTGARFVLAAVADGMGGHQSGEIASSLALDLLRQQLGTALLAPRSSPVNPRRLPEQLEQIVPAIGRALSERAQLDPQLGGMGTTLIGFASLGQLTNQSVGGSAKSGMRCAAVFSVGDSRAYLLTPLGLRRLSRDHSLVQDLLDSGAISEKEAADHPQRNVITRCLGGGSSNGEPDVFEFTAGPGEIILLASDGLTDMLSEEELWRAVGEADTTDLDALARHLVEAADVAGGKDNITVVLIGCGL